MLRANPNHVVVTFASSKKGRTDQTVVREYDEYGRIVCVDYGKGEIEKFTYDKWVRIASHTHGKVKETYAYDAKGRLARQVVD